MASFTALPGVLNVNTSGVTVTCTGVSTSWTNTTVFSLSGGTTASITSQTYNSATSFTLLITSGTSLGTLTLSDSTDAATTTIQVVNWAIVTDDDFNRATGNVGSPSHVDGSLAYFGSSTDAAWSDVFSGGYSSISGGALLNSTGTNYTYPIIRTESAVNQRHVVRVLPNTATNASNVIASVRNQNMVSASNYNHYRLAVAFSAGGTVVITANATTGGGNLVSTTWTPTTGHIYELDFSAYGTNPTYLQGYVYDCGTDGKSHTLVLSLAATNSASVLQSAGVVGYGVSAFGAGASVIGYHSTNYLATTEQLNPTPTSLQYNVTSQSVALAGVGTSWSGSPFTIYNYQGFSNVTLTSQSVSSGTAGSLVLNTGSQTGTLWIIDNNGIYYYLVVAVGGITLTPNTLKISTTANIDISGVGTTWTAGTPGSPTFTVSSGATINSQVVNSSTDATLNITAGGTVEVVTITDPSTGNTASLQLYTNVSVLDANTDFSPYNWYFNGSTYAQTTFWGAYIKMYFNGPSLTVNIDTSVNSGTTLSNVYFTAVIDGLQETTYSLANVSGTGTLVLASGLSTGTHAVWITYMGYGAEDAWVTPAAALRITSFTLSPGYTTTAITGSIGFTTYPLKKALIYGDSISAGVGVGTVGATYGVPTIGSDGRGNYVDAVMRFLNCEYGQAACGGTGWIAPAGSTGVPGFYAHWNYYFENTSRLTGGGSFIGGNPDYIIINHGTNDYTETQSTLQTSIVSTMTAIRAAAPVAWIYILCPFGGYISTGSNVTLQNAFAQYQGATPDPRCFLIQSYLNQSQYGLANRATGGSNYYSIDDLHPYQGRNQTLAAMVTNGIITVSPGFVATPNALATSATQTIVFTNPLASWTGTPLTASAGTILSQTCNSATQITISYTAPSSSQAITFTDSTSSDTTVVAVTGGTTTTKNTLIFVPKNAAKN